MTEINNYRVIKYFRLRPAFFWSAFSFFLMLSLLFIISWSNEEDLGEYLNLEEFQMVELSISQPVTEPDIAVSEESVEVIEKKEEKLKFGIDDGECNDLTDSAIPPRPKFNSLPEYPDSLRHEGIEGIVVIELGIDEHGNIIYGRICNSLGKKFDIAVMNWAREIKFYPALTPDRIPFKCRIRLPIRFKLES